MNRRFPWRGGMRGSHGGYAGSQHHGGSPNNYNQPAYSTQSYNPGLGKPPVQQQQGSPPKPVPPPTPQAVPPPTAQPPSVQPPAAALPATAPQQAPPTQQIGPPPAAKDETVEQGPPQQGEGEPMDAAEGDGTQGGPNNTNGKKRFHNWVWYRKSPGMYMRVSKKIRKRRQNARLRHLLAPKNAMMVLHELYPELKMVVSEQVNAANQMVYTVDIEIDGKVYRGHGMSKIAAKQAGSENALKAVLLEKLTQNNVKMNPDEDPLQVKMEVEEKPSEQQTEEQKSEKDTDTVDMKPSEEGSAEVKAEGNPEEGGQQQPPFKRFPEDDVPWGSLASYALYKLFTEWQAQGFQLPASSNMAPMFQKSNAIPVPMGAGAAAPMKKIPEDANQKHPVQLLNQIRPGCQYSETRVGDPPNLTFTFTVAVDGQTFQGVGHNKKDAKKECAKRALESMGVKYD